MSTITLKSFFVYAISVEQHIYESSDCPSYWHGSGCYDESFYTMDVEKYTVVAESEDRATDMVVERLQKKNHYDFEVLGCKEFSDENLDLTEEFCDFEEGAEEVEESKKDDFDWDLEKAVKFFGD